MKNTDINSICGDNPKSLKRLRMAEDWGYDEINFNVGCPSPRVCSRT